MVDAPVTSASATSVGVSGWSALAN